MKTTPGPWRAEQCAVYGPGTPTGRDCCIAVAERRQGADPEIAVANAQLISAAPDLLGVLRQMTEAFKFAVECGSRELEGFDAEEHGLIKASRAAIAKAEGRSRT